MSNDDILEKVRKFHEVLDQYKDFIVDIAIESPNVMFSEGRSTAQVLSLLSMFNGMCQSACFLLYNIKPTMYNVNTARSACGVKFPKGSNRKEVVRDFVSGFWSEIDWPVMTKGKNIGSPRKECFDMADSAIIALCHVRKLNANQEG